MRQGFLLWVFGLAAAVVVVEIVYHLVQSAPENLAGELFDVERQSSADYAATSAGLATALRDVRLSVQTPTPLLGDADTDPLYVRSPLVREPWVRVIADRLSSTGAQKDTVFIIPVNGAFLDLGYNLWCSLLRINASANFIFAPLEPSSAALLAHLGLPHYVDPWLFAHSGVTDRFAAFGANPSFKAATCAKPAAALRLVQRGFTVGVVDADVVFLQPPLSTFATPVTATASASSSSAATLLDHLNLDAAFSWGGHEGPRSSSDRTTPSCAEAHSFTASPPPPPITPHACYVNTGFYIVRGTSSTSQSPSGWPDGYGGGGDALLREWVTRCRGGNTDDQTILNDRFLSPLRKNTSHFTSKWVDQLAEMKGEVRGSKGKGVAEKEGSAQPHAVGMQTAPFRIGCFDPCRWQNGNTAFKYGVGVVKDPSTGTPVRPDVVMVHANFLRGVDTKRKSLANAHLYDAPCVTEYMEKAKAFRNARGGKR